MHVPGGTACRALFREHSLRRASFRKNASGRIQGMQDSEGCRRLRGSEGSGCTREMQGSEGTKGLQSARVRGTRGELCPHYLFTG